MTCRILGWQPEKPPDARPHHERIVVIKHAFLREDFEVDLLLLVAVDHVYCGVDCLTQCYIPAVHCLQFS